MDFVVFERAGLLKSMYQTVSAMSASKGCESSSSGIWCLIVS